MSETALRLEPGKHYKTRGGNHVVISGVGPDGTGWGTIHYDGLANWGPDGVAEHTREIENDDHDIVREATPKEVSYATLPRPS